MADLLIRPARESEVPEVLALIRELASAEEFPFAVTVTDDDLRESLFGSRPAASVLLGVAEGLLAGFAVYYETFSAATGRRGLHLDDLFVRPAFRGKGYGKAFLRHLARVARERGCARFEWRVLTTNTSAIRFFTSIGARKMDELRIFRVQGEALERLAGSR